jgi:7-carboxy-7-deazaguanine synthase
MYSVKEVFLTLQGEGFNAGRRAVFCRFSGCNLWSGVESARATAMCSFCDTDFVGTDGPGGGKFSTAESLANRILKVWGTEPNRRFVVFTGGEPLLQLDQMLIGAVASLGFLIAVETNGTIPPPSGIHWLTVSPKGAASLQALDGQELKLAYPQPMASPDQFSHLSFQHFFLQPIDGPALSANMNSAVRYCLANPRWRLSLQMHKFAGFS